MMAVLSPPETYSEIRTRCEDAVYPRQVRKDPVNLNTIA